MEPQIFLRLEGRYNDRDFHGLTVYDIKDVVYQASPFRKYCKQPAFDSMCQFMGLEHVAEYMPVAVYTLHQYGGILFT